MCIKQGVRGGDLHMECIGKGFLGSISVGGGKPGRLAEIQLCHGEP